MPRAGACLAPQDLPRGLAWAVLAQQVLNASEHHAGVEEGAVSCGLGTAQRFPWRAVGVGGGACRLTPSSLNICSVPPRKACLPLAWHELRWTVGKALFL